MPVFQPAGRRAFAPDGLSAPARRYLAERAAWTRAFEDWIADGRPDFLVVEPVEAAPAVGGQREGCREPGACRADGPDLCRQCAAMLSEAEAA